MKLNKHIFSDEWKRLTLGGGIVGLIYLLIAIPTGLSGLVNRALFPPVGSLCGVLFGCAVLFLNTLLLEWTVKSVPQRGVKLYTLSYLARYLMKGAAICGFCRSFFPEDHLSFLRTYREKRSCGLLDKDGKLSGDRPDFSCYTFSARQGRLPWRKLFFI